MIFALGFLLLLVEFAKLARGAHERGRYEAVEQVSSWTGGRYVARRRRSEPGEPDEPLPPVPEPLGVPLATPAQLGAAVAVAVALLFAFLPSITRAAESSTQYHHLQHAAQFLLGVILGVLVVSLPAVSSRLGRRAADAGIAAVIVAPTVMLLLMLPDIYAPLETRPFEHFLYHVGMVALGLVAGLGAGALGRVTGRLAVVLAVGMALMYAAGVGGS